MVPLFRSRAQALLLEQLALYRTQPATLNELADATGVSYHALYKEVRRLEQAGLVTVGKIGNVLQVALDRASPAAEPLVALLEATLGVRQHLAHRLCGLDGLVGAWIYGSWAARYTGVEDGPAPQDIDVLVVADDRLPARQVRDACAAAGRQVAREVNAVVVAPGEWDRADSGFLREVKTGPLVAICPATSRGPDDGR
ncbi:MAG TPA: winged helix-turn-helix domain-containing protein [Nitriliruptorales bacterium]